MEVKGVRRTIHRCMTLMHMIRLRIGDAEYDAGRVLYQSDSTSEGSWRAAGSRTTTRVSDSFVHVNNVFVQHLCSVKVGKECGSKRERLHSGFIALAH